MCIRAPGPVHLMGVHEICPMFASSSIVRPLLQALAFTGMGVLAFAGLDAAGFATEPSLFAALIVAGGLNIGALATLNGEVLHPTSGMPVGDLSR